jgi:hypothetical protein
MYSIGMFTAEGIKILEQFETYSEADENLDLYCDQYPDSYVDIINSSEVY